MTAMRDVDTAPMPATDERTVLVVTHLRDERLLSLVAGSAPVLPRPRRLSTVAPAFLAA
jgi:hypothetical protein